MSQPKGCRPWNKGIPRTVEEKAKMSRGQKARYHNGAVNPNLGKHLSEATREKLSKARKGKHLGEENQFYGKHHTPNTIELLSIQRIEWHKNNPSAFADSNNPMYENKEAGEKISKAAKARWQDPEWRENQCQIRKELWQRPEHREKQIKAILRGLCQRPTEYEQKIIDLIQKHNLPFKYVGNGEVIIGYVNPDFININGQKSLIETYCFVWHKPNYEIERVKRFAQYGYRTLFLNDNDLEPNNWEEICLAKIKEFMAENMVFGVER